MDRNNKILEIYFDLKKRLTLGIIRYKLSDTNYYLGIRGTMHNWIKDYLTNRKQFTYCNGVSSNIGDVVCGVPRGNVPGPLSFLIYMNDISGAVGDK